MRAAILAPGLAYDAGAIPIRARLAGNELVERGHQVVGFGMELRGFGAAEARFPIHRINAPKLPPPFASLTVWLSYERMMASQLLQLDAEAGGLDLVVSHWQTHGLAASVIRRKTRARWVSMVQRTIYDTMRSGNAGRNFLMNRLTVSGCAREFSRADAVIALHDAMAREIRDHVPQTRRVEVIPNGVWIPRDDLGALRAIKTSATVIYVGRLDPEKRVDIVIRGFAEARLELTTLIIVGDGPQRQALQDLAAHLGCSERIEFVGSVPHPEALEWMKRSSVFVLASSSEGMPFVVLEAMAAGCGIVCSDIDGNRAILGPDDACFVPVGDAGAIAAALRELFRDEARLETCSARAFQRARDFDWSAIIQREVDLYEDLASEVTAAAAE